MSTIARPFYGWVIVGGTVAVLTVAYGTQYAFGIFFSAILAEFGWSRASLAGVFSVYTMAYSACGLIAGQLTDRWGPRAILAAGGVLLGTALVGMSGVTALWHPYVLYGVVGALGMSTAFVPCQATVARWFVRRRGFALGVASAGISLGTLLWPPCAHYLVTRVGWRWSYAIFGAAVFVVFGAVARIMRRDPESVGLAPDGRPRLAGPVPTAPAERSLTVSAAMRTRAFWTLLAVFAATWVPVFVPVVHLVPLAKGLGVAPLLAATLVSALGAADLFGRLLIGATSDRVGRRVAMAIGFSLQVAGFAALASAGSLPGLYAGALLFGVSYGAVSSLFPAIVADFFGRGHAGGLVGIFFATAGSMAAVGPIGAGWIYDRAGSYAPALWLSAGFNALALALLVFARPPRRPRGGVA